MAHFISSNWHTLDIALRLFATALAGGLIGIERESHGRAAGMRTTMLVATAACLAMLLSSAIQMPFVEANLLSRPDPARLAQGILSGMGFLGAGAIIRNGNRVQGMTTAATLWFVSVIGLLFGDGQWMLGATGSIMALVILRVLTRLEERVKEDWYATVGVTLQLDGLDDRALRDRIETHGVKVRQMDLDYDMVNRTKTLNCSLKFKKERVFTTSQAVVSDLTQCGGILHVSWT